MRPKGTRPIRPRVSRPRSARLPRRGQRAARRRRSPTAGSSWCSMRACSQPSQRRCGCSLSHTHFTCFTSTKVQILTQEKAKEEAAALQQHAAAAARLESADAQAAPEGRVARRQSARAPPKRVTPPLPPPQTKTLTLVLPSLPTPHAAKESVCPMPEARRY
jgi:hypothetical protein